MVVFYVLVSVLETLLPPCSTGVWWLSCIAKIQPWRKAKVLKFIYSMILHLLQNKKTCELLLSQRWSWISYRTEFYIRYLILGEKMNNNNCYNQTDIRLTQTLDHKHSQRVLTKKGSSSKFFDKKMIFVVKFIIGKKRMVNRKH